jgi:hypothetical protein
VESGVVPGPAAQAHQEKGPPPGEARLIAVRAFATESSSTEDDDCGEEWQGDCKRPGPSQSVLIFDTETTGDAAQQLRVGAYQFRQDGELAVAGLFYDPESLELDEMRVVCRYAADHDLEIRVAAEFVDEVFFKLAYERHATIVGFDLPFGISRLAIKHHSARRSMRGGFTLRLSTKRKWPDVEVKHLSGAAALIRFAERRKRDVPGSWRGQVRMAPVNRGCFCDVSNLAAALTGKSRRLSQLAELLEATRKLDTEDGGGLVTEEFLDHVTGDVQTIWECFAKLAERYRSFGLSAYVHSEANFGKAYFDEMGVPRWRDSQPDFRPEMIGTIISSYYGGRSEVRVRRRITRCLNLRFLSQYTSCCVLMGLWRYMIATGIEHEDATVWARRFLENVTLDKLKDKSLWRELPVLVQVKPATDIFPVRANYGEEQPYTVGLNWLSSEEPLWYTLADCIASKLLTGKAPQVVSALRFLPGPMSQNLQGIDIAGNFEYHIEPSTDDLFKRLIELRSRIKRQEKAAESAGNTRLAARLQAEQQALEITASATTHDIFSEMNAQEHERLRELVCHSAKGDFPSCVHNVEEPGKFFHPLLGSLITGAAHLLLASAERVAHDEGLGWVFCDTDNMCVACPDGMADEEFIARAGHVQMWFTDLSPYDTDDQLFEMERENYALNGGGFEPLYAFAVSSKRYCLFNLDGCGRPIIRRASVRGLSHLRPPYHAEHAPRDLPQPLVAMDDLGVERWQHDLWYRIVTAALCGDSEAVDYTMPGFDKPAVSRFAATNPSLLRWFGRFNADKSYREQVRPFGFLLAYQPEPTLIAAKELPSAVSPYDEDVLVASKNCFERNSGNSIDPGDLRTYSRVLREYHLHPEAKFANAESDDMGLTRRRHILAIGQEHIGKEAHNWEQQVGLRADPATQTRYGMPAGAYENHLEAIFKACQPFGAGELAHEAGLAASVVANFVNGRGRPARDSLSKLAGAASRLASRQATVNTGTDHSPARQLCKLETVHVITRPAGPD